MEELKNSISGSLGYGNRTGDSPQLWIGAISSSLLLHILMGLGLLGSTMIKSQVNGNDQKIAHTPIEFITIPPETSSIVPTSTLPEKPLDKQDVASTLPSPQVQSPQPVPQKVTAVTSVAPSPSPEMEKVRQEGNMTTLKESQDEPIGQQQSARVSEQTEQPISPQIEEEKPLETSPLVQETESPDSSSSKKLDSSITPSTPLPTQKTDETPDNPSQAEPQVTQDEIQPIAQQNFPIATDPDNYPFIVSEVSTTPDSSPSSFQGLIANLGTPRLTNPEIDIPDRLAKAIQSRQEFSIRYLSPLEDNFDGSSVIEAVVIIDDQGRATVDLIKILEGNLKPEKAEKLAQEIIEQWKFEPTYMEGKPIYQAYFIQLKTSPL